MENCAGCGFKRENEDCGICREIDIWYNRAVENTLQVCIREIENVWVSADNDNQYSRGMVAALMMVEARLHKLYNDFKESTESKPQ